MFCAAVKLRIALCLIFIFTLGYGGFKSYRAGQESVQSRWDAEKAVQQGLARQQEHTLQAVADRLRLEKENEIQTLNARHRVIIDGLRQRTPRPVTLPSVAQPDAASVPQCDGRQLYREDGEFLAREAARADQIKAALEQCTAQYDAARELNLP